MNATTDTQRIEIAAALTDLGCALRHSAERDAAARRLDLDPATLTTNCIAWAMVLPGLMRDAVAMRPTMPYAAIVSGVMARTVAKIIADSMA